MSGKKLLLDKRQMKIQVYRNEPRNQERLFTMIKTFSFFVLDKCLEAMQLCSGSSTVRLQSSWIGLNVDVHQIHHSFLD